MRTQNISIDDGPLDSAVCLSGSFWIIDGFGDHGKQKAQKSMNK